MNITKAQYVSETPMPNEPIIRATIDGIAILAGISSQDLNFTKTTSGDILYVEVTTDATTETYTEITPSGTETWTDITPSGAETWTEIEA